MLRIQRPSTATDCQSDRNEYVPLKQVNVEANIRSFAADVIIKQVFRNEETSPIEAVYCFPIEEQAAVYAFVARIDDREIVAQLKEKKEAQKEYNNALRQGDGAYLLEQDEKSQDNFIISVGALPPGKECHISISYVSELDLVDNGRKIRFVVPTTIAPRYNPGKGGIDSPAETTSKYVQTSPYMIEFRCRVDKLNITHVSSTSHPIRVDLDQQDVYVIEFAQPNTHLDRDILVDIELAENRSNTIVTVESTAVMASFTPVEEHCRRARNNTEMINEFIFLVDCSGSMADSNKIELARQAMILFLKSLPIDCHFNIIRFGSNYENLFDDITDKYNETNLRKAEQLTNQMQADLGGTELLGPLEWLEEHPPARGCARQIFLLTDGEISNVNEVLDLCRSMATSTRIFSFGLGHSPSRSLVKGLARATNGCFVFIPPGSSVDIYVGEQLQKALQSCITDVQIKWNLATSVMSAPAKIPPVYANDRLIVYALADDQTFIFDHNASVELYSCEHQLGKAKVDRVPNVSTNGTIARLAAKAMILELQHSKLPPSTKENMTGSLQTRIQVNDQPSTATTIDEKETTKKRIIDLSLKYKILSPHTAFIGIEKRMNTSNSDMVLREVPIQISVDDQYSETIHCIQPQMASSYKNNRMMMKRFLLDDEEGYRCLRWTPSVDYQLNNECDVEEELSENEEDLNENETFDHNATANTNVVVPSNDVNERKRKCPSPEETEEPWPTDDQNIVRYLINKQKFDGLWDLDAKNIEHLTGKPLVNFPEFSNREVLVSAVVVVALETRFTSLSMMWHGVVQKARKRLLDLLDNDSNKLDSLLESIRRQF